MGRDDQDDSWIRRNFGRIDPFCLFAVIPLAAVGIAVIFSDAPFLAPILLFFAAIVVAFDSWLHRPGRLIEPRAAKAALRRSKEAEQSGISDIRRVPRTGSQQPVRGASGRNSPNGRPRPQNGSYQPSRQQPRARQASGMDQRGRSSRY